MKKILSVFLVISLLLCCAPTVFAADTEIADATAFMAIGNNAVGSYKLTEDIDLTNCSYTSLSGFAGTLDGNGHTIKLAVTGLANAGLFQTAGGAVIKNLTVDGTVSGTTNAAGFVGNATSSITFENCVNKARISDGQTVGGFVADAHTGFSGGITITNSSNYGNVTASSMVGGGFLGKALTMNITNSVNYGDVYATMRVAGFVGWHTGYSESHVDNCANFGNITCTSEQSISGPAGIVSTTCSGTVITNCFNAGSATLASGTPANYCAGIASMIHSTKNVSISNCLSIGTTKSAVYSSTNSVTPNILSNNYYLSGSCTDAGDASASAKTDTELKDSAMLTLLGSGWAFQSGCDYPLPTGMTYAPPAAPDNTISTAEDFKTKIAADKAGVYDVTASFALTDYTDLLTDFSGTLNGNGNTITVHISSEGQAGLFYNLAAGAAIKDLTIEGSVTGTANVGTLAGITAPGVSIANCVNKADVSGTGNVGGFIGSTSSYSDNKNIVSFENSVNMGTVLNTATANYRRAAGGFIGFGSFQTTFVNCQNYGNVNDSVDAGKAGGFVGWIAKSFDSCANFGVIRGFQTGGLIGVSQYINTTMSNCLNSGEVRAIINNGDDTGDGGGLIGQLVSGSTATLTNCYDAGQSFCWDAQENKTLEGTAAMYGTQASNSAVPTVTGSVYIDTYTTESISGAVKVSAEMLSDISILSTLGSSFAFADVESYDYPVPNGLADKLVTNTVTVTVGANGSVTPSGVRKVFYHRPLTLTATPDENYYVSGGSFGDTPIIWDRDEDGSGTYTTPSVTADTEITVIFSKKNTDLTNAMTDFANTFEDTDGSIIKFASVKDDFYNIQLVEYGVLYIADTTISEEDFVYDAVGVMKLEGKSINSKGQFGIGVRNNKFVECKRYKIRAYARYSDGTIVYSAPKDIQFNDLI